MSQTAAKTVPTTVDRDGASIVIGDLVQILGVTPDPDMDEDDLDMFMEMIGSTCEVEAIDEDGLAWVTVWWNTVDGSLTTTVGLEPAQMRRDA
jgi:hypothetical protein